jgi:hypothetical protein
LTYSLSKLIFEKDFAMKWTRSNFELPADKEEVIIKYRGIFYLAVFYKEGKTFFTKCGQQFQAGDGLIWAGLLGSEVKSKEEPVTH